MIDALLIVLLAAFGSGSDDPYRYCYAPTGSVGWACYLTDDRPTDVLPVWQGWESQIPGATSSTGGAA